MLELDCEESWAQKNWCIWTVVLEKTLESPLDCKEIQPVHPKGISPGCSLEGLMLKLKFQYFGHLMQRTDSCEKTLKLGMIEDRRRRGRQRMRWLDGITDSMDMICMNSGSWWWSGRPGVLQVMGSQRIGHNWATELNCTEEWSYENRMRRCLCTSWEDRSHQKPTLPSLWPWAFSLQNCIRKHNFFV